MLKQWKIFIKDLRRIARMRNTLAKMKGGLAQCHKPY